MLRQSLPQGNIWPLPTTMISLRPTPCTPWAKPFCSCGRRASRTASSTAMKHSFPRASSGPWWPTSSRITPRTTCCAATTSATWRCSKRRCGMRSAGSGRSATAVRTTICSCALWKRPAARPMYRRCCTTGGCTQAPPLAAPMPSPMWRQQPKRRWPTIWPAPDAPAPWRTACSPVPTG